MSSSAWTLLQQPSEHLSDHLDRFVLWRVLPGCCVATSLVACPGSSIARELIPLGGGIGSDTAAILLGLKLYNSFPFLHRYITLIAGSHHLISQAGWNRCNLSIYLSINTGEFFTLVWARYCYYAAIYVARRPCTDCTFCV